jgi:hypothetical protein
LFYRWVRIHLCVFWEGKQTKQRPNKNQTKKQAKPRHKKKQAKNKTKTGQTKNNQKQTKTKKALIGDTETTRLESCFGAFLGLFFFWKCF